LFLFGSGCEPVEFGFGEDDDTDSVDTGTADDPCDNLELEHVHCQLDAGPAPECLGSIHVATEQIDLSAGCTPAGQALGVAEFATTSVDAGPIDLFAWVTAPADEPGPFADEVYLSIFEDDCGDDPFGESTVPDCDYEPWLVTPEILADAPVYVHVQTLAATIEGAPRELAYQVRSSGTWTWPLPANGPLRCLDPIDPVSPGPHVSQVFLESPLWDGQWHVLDLSGAPPALGGEPRICPAGSGGWRQAAFQLRNLGDEPLPLTLIDVGRRISPVTVETVPFHFEILACADSPLAEGGEIPPGEQPLASSCHDDGDHSSKELSLALDPWIPWEPGTQYVLIVQVPPGAGMELEITFGL
jgi:hypothetical protein